MTREITARKKLKAEREQLSESERAARAEAERSSLLNDEFLATIERHLGLVANLGDRERNAQAQTQLIEDLLDMSRIVSGKSRLDVQWTDLASVVNAVVHSVRPASDAKGVRLRTILAPHAGPVSGDPTGLQQVVWNLLSNAIKFTPKGDSVDVFLERVNRIWRLRLPTPNGWRGSRTSFHKEMLAARIAIRWASWPN